MLLWSLLMNRKNQLEAEIPKQHKPTVHTCKCWLWLLDKTTLLASSRFSTKYKLSLSCSVLFVSPGCVCVTWLALSVVQRLTTKESVWKKQETSTRRCSFWENASMLWDTISRPSERFIHPSFPLCLWLILSFIYIINHNTYQHTLYHGLNIPTILEGKTPTTMWLPMREHLVTVERKSSLWTGRKLVQNFAQRGAESRERDKLMFKCRWCMNTVR